jgi:hypothetical protein
LYVQVIDGLINVANSGGASNFAAGQFGYVPNASHPPVLVPQNPGIKFTPPPAFSSPGTVVIPIGTSGVAGNPYNAPSDGSGGVVFPFSLTATTGATFVLASAANAPPSVAFLSSSTANVLVGATAATLALPQIDASLDASMTFGPTTGAGTTLQATFQTDPAPVSVTTSAHARSPQGIGGAFTAIDNVQISQLQTVSFAQTPAFTFGLGQPSPPVAGVSYYVVLYDVKNPSAGLTTIAGPGVVSGNTVTFASVARATTLQANDTYTYELIQTTQTLATPTPTATAAPTASPTPMPTPAPTATPTVAPTATQAPVPTATPAIATVSSTIVPSFGILSVPVLSGVLNGDGSLAYNQTSTGSTQNMTVSASTGNFASLTTPAGQTALVYLTVGFPSGADLTFGTNFSPPSLYLAGTVFQLGSTYTVTFTLPNGTTLPSQTGVAAFDDGPHGPGAVIFVNSPLQSLTLSANQTIGITVSH